MSHRRKLIDAQNHFIKVSDLHTIHVIEAGNKEGPAVLFMHGGPGSGVNTKFIDYIDCNFYRVFLIDQRGAGQSSPLGELEDNNVDALISDIEFVRQAFDINKWILTAGSWGSFLAAYYTANFPNRVLGLLLRGCFMASSDEIDWLYSGYGAAAFYPEVWEKFLGTCPNNKRNDILRCYYEKLTSNEDAIQWTAAKNWLDWASISMNELQVDQSYSEENKKRAIAKARIMSHFLHNQCFLDDSFSLLSTLGTLKHIPIWIVNGRNDVICPVATSWRLSKVHDNTRLVILDGAGHSPANEEVRETLFDFFNEFKIFAGLTPIT